MNLNYISSEVVEIGSIDGNQPKKNFYDQNAPKLNSSLITSDIKGAQANTL